MISYILNSDSVVEDVITIPKIYLEDEPDVGRADIGRVEIKSPSFRRASCQIKIDDYDIDVFEMKVDNKIYLIDTIAFGMIRSKNCSNIYLLKTHRTDTRGDTHGNTKIYTASLKDIQSQHSLGYTHLGKGGQGQVIGNGNIVEKIFSHKLSAIKEIAVYKYLSHSYLYGNHIPKLHAFDVSRKTLYLEQLSPTTNRITYSNVKKIIEILSYVSSIGIINSDIKPQNIILLSDKVYVIDWGNSVIDRSRLQCQYRGTCGTRKYMCPEYLMIKASEYKEVIKDTDHYVSKGRNLIQTTTGNKIDVWSLGITILSSYYKHKKMKWNDVDEYTLKCYLNNNIDKLFLSKEDKEYLTKKYPILPSLLEMNMKKRCDFIELNKIVNNIETDIDFLYGTRIYPLNALSELKENRSRILDKFLSATEGYNRRYDILFNSIEMFDYFAYKMICNGDKDEISNYDTNDFIVLSRSVFRNSEIEDKDITKNSVRIMNILNGDIIFSGFYTYVTRHCSGNLDKLIKGVFSIYKDIENKRVVNYSRNLRKVKSLI